MAPSVLERDEPGVQSASDSRRAGRGAVVGRGLGSIGFIPGQLDVHGAPMRRDVQSAVLHRALSIWPAMAVLIMGLSVVPSLHAHIGSPAVFFEGQAGPYGLRVVVRPPEVIPGLAEVSVRLATNGIER